MKLDNPILTMQLRKMGLQKIILTKISQLVSVIFSYLNPEPMLSLVSFHLRLLCMICSINRFWKSLDFFFLISHCNLACMKIFQVDTELYFLCTRDTKQASLTMPFAVFSKWGLDIVKNRLTELLHTEHFYFLQKKTFFFQSIHNHLFLCYSPPSIQKPELKQLLSGNNCRNMYTCFALNV